MITLICEDDLLIAQDIMEQMNAAGLKSVGPARNMDEAMSAAERYNVAIALIDLTLADGRSGVELARALYRRGCAIIVCSADVLPPEELSDMDHKFLRKPTPPGAIVDCVRAAMSGQRPLID
jgi:DNA-binding NarL/FixJ family response regulator